MGGGAPLPKQGGEPEEIVENGGVKYRSAKSKKDRSAKSEKALPLSRHALDRSRWPRGDVTDGARTRVRQDML
eukprot:5124465-Prymnesium_polylepis.1